MGFNAVNAFWLLPFLGLIVLMYLLKEEHEEKEISSLYLWKTVMANSEVKKPWQKLKNNILMILQLLAAFLIIITLAKPYIKTQKALSGNIIIVIDNSGSMNALLKEKSRLEIAKNMAENIVKEAEHNSFFTVISSAGDAKIEISNIKDKAEIINTIKAIKKSDMEGNLEKQKSIIKAIYNQYQDVKVLAYTDEPFALNDMIGEVINLGGSGDNAAIINMSYKEEEEEEDGCTVLVRVQNNGDNSQIKEISLYGDDSLIELKELEIKSGSIASVYFYGIEKSFNYLMAELSPSDALIDDDRAYLTMENAEKKKILMFSKGNTFLERALLAIENLELYKTESIDALNEYFDLYIFDDFTPDTMPRAGAVFLVNIDKNNLLELADNAMGIAAYFQPDSSINKHIENHGFYINRAKIFKKPVWAEPVIVSEKGVLAGIGISEGRQIAYITFDLHESDLPLTPSFPILIYNIVFRLTNMEPKGKGYYESGETIDLIFAPDIKEMEITSPSKKTVKIKESILPYGYSNTDETGIYIANFVMNDKTYKKYFAVNFPTVESTNAFLNWSALKNDTSEQVKGNAVFDLDKIFIMIIILILFIEWAVYNRGV